MLVCRVGRLPPIGAVAVSKHVAIKKQFSGCPQPAAPRRAASTLRTFLCCEDLPIHRCRLQVSRQRISDFSVPYVIASEFADSVDRP